MKIKSARSSLMTIIEKCPPAAFAPDVMIDGSNPESRLGNAGHEAMEIFIGRDEFPDLAAIAEKWEVDRDEVGMLFALGRRAWESVKQWFPHPQCEKLIVVGGAITVTSHPDVFAVYRPEDEPPCVNVFDHKFGRLDPDPEAQVKSYCRSVLHQVPDVDRARAAVSKPRDGWIEWYPLDKPYWTRQELDEWWARIETAILENPRFNPGPWCGFCPRGHECDARSALMRQAGTFLMDQDSWVIPSDPLMRGAMLGEVYERVKLVENACKKARDLVRAEVIESGGLIPTADGKGLVLTDQQQRRIRSVPAWPILRDRLGEDEAIDCATFGKGAVEDAIKAKSPKGSKGTDAADFIEKLDAAGAIEIVTIQKLEHRRLPKQLEKKP